MNKIQIQGLTFSLIAIFIALVSVFLPQIHSVFSLFILAVLIFFLGVPHGALDPIFAQKRFFLKDWKAWSTFVCVYLALSALVVLIWWQLPLFFMVGFLVCSAMHFSRDLTSNIPKMTRFFYGGATIVLPSIFHLSEMQWLFSLILDSNTGLQITRFLHVLAWPWLVLGLVGLYLGFVKDKLVGLEVLAVGLLATLAPPLVGFTVYFCGMHSLRHILRSQDYAQLSLIKLSLISLAPMLGVILIAVLGWIYLPVSSDDARILRFLFVGLAALTLPHMLLIDRIRYQR
jgi:Brp/Blh family beta-carotene 15,15'-monooxygenase